MELSNVSVLDTRRKILLNTPHIDTSVGDLVTFNTDLSAPLKSCKVSFLPVQEGEGDPSPDNVRNITGWDGVSVGLPSEYQEVEYIENTKKGGVNQYINTNIIPNENMRVYMEGTTNDNINSAGFLFGSRTSENLERFWGITWLGYYKYGFSNDSNKSISSAQINEDFIFDFNHDINHSITVNGTTKIPTIKTPNTYTYPIYIFGINNNGKLDTAQQQTFKIKKFRIYNHYNDTTPILNFIPCYRKSDNEIGMYDTVSKQFFTNQGTGTFLKGTDVDRIHGSIDWTNDVGTVYGGYVDLVSGELVATHLAFVMDGVNHKVSTGAGVNTNNNMARGHAFMGRTGGLENVPLGKNNSGLYAVNKYIIHGVENGAGNTAVEGVYCGTGTPYIRVVVSVDDLADVSGANAILNSINEWLTNNPVQICYTLAEPIHYQLPPQQILTLKGINNVYSDTNGQTEIKYWKH